MSDQDPIETFRLEARELLEQIETDLLTLADDAADRETIDSVFRGLHTLKGSGAMFGFDDLAAFTHHCETAFDRVRKGQAPASPALISAVLAARDHMRALAEGLAFDPGVEARLLEDLRRSVEGAETAPPAPAAPPAAKSWRVRFALPADALVNGVRPLPLLDEFRALGPCLVKAITDKVPPLSELTPTACHLAWEVVVTTAEPRSVIEDIFIFVADDMELEIAEIDEPASAKLVEAAEAAEAAETAAPKAANDAAPGDAKGGANRNFETVRVPAERLDELMDRVGELVIAQSRLKQIAATSADVALRAVAEEIERLASEMRETMMIVRMVPISQLFGRFKRLIHDLARDTGKQIVFTTEGETTELDKTVIERLADPLVHLIRNAADHGLEPPEQREAVGKSREGTVHLSARQAGAEVIITIADDGRGVDRARVRAKAEENGLITPGQALSDTELLQLIFAPGFSTAAAVTNLSGRGVGMDVVKKTIEGLGGSIALTSEMGRGATISLRIPLTLAIIDGLLVRVGQGRYIIPLASVDECVELSPAQDTRSTARSFITLRDRLVPFLRLRELFAVADAADRHQKIVVVSTSEERVGLVVDQILGDHQTVIKPLSDFHASIGAFSGATILGDGGVALILEVPSLVSLGQSDAPRALAG
ncbi:chemotaxis protein CheA [uncultured Caulobacter sp.]|uniref:chemotaxis protein CheA n=1 Tax=uncultured Caulobacter sp. TaxID=158749 RepID=UPI00260939B5|nr:chemotaxis protein CheA [uncultured Caulobacter sp.]